MTIKNGFEYTHIDGDGILWRFQGSMPLSEIADEVMSGAYKGYKNAIGGAGISPKLTLIEGGKKN